MDNELSIVGAGSQFLVDYMRQVNMATQGQQKLPNDYDQPLVNDILANQERQKMHDATYQRNQRNHETNDRIQNFEKIDLFKEEGIHSINKYGKPEGIEKLGKNIDIIV